MVQVIFKTRMDFINLLFQRQGCQEDTEDSVQKTDDRRQRAAGFLFSVI